MSTDTSTNTQSDIDVEGDSQCPYASQNSNFHSNFYNRYFKKI